MIWLSTSRTSRRLDGGRPDQARVSGSRGLVGCERGGDGGASGVGHGGPPSDWPSDSPNRDWHHRASCSSAVTLILGGSVPAIQPVA